MIYFIIQKLKSNYFILNDNAYKFAKQIILDEYEMIPTNQFELFKRKALMGDVVFQNNEDKQFFFKDLDIKMKESKIHDNNPIELLIDKK